jgi:hypothetical protein
MVRTTSNIDGITLRERGSGAGGVKRVVTANVCAMAST